MQVSGVDDNIPLQQFWSLTDHYPDLVCHLHVQVTFMGNLGLMLGVPWFSDTDCLKCFICKNGIEGAGHFFFECMSFGKNFTVLWSNLKTTLFKVKPFESNFTFSSLENLIESIKPCSSLEAYLYHSTVKQLLS